MIEGILSPAHISATDALETARAKKIERGAEHEDVRKAANEYESYFLAYLMKMMRKTVPKGSLTANPMGEAFHSFYDQEIGKRAAQAGGIGLADFVLSSLSEAPPQAPSQDTPKSGR